MTLFDISVLFFFACVLVKAASDAVTFWKDEDEFYAAATSRKVAPLHRPAPVRTSPASIPVRRRAAVTCAKRKVTPIPAKKDMVA